MKNILFIVAVIISISFISCDFTSEKVKKQNHKIDSLQNEIKSLKEKNELLKRDKKHYDSLWVSEVAKNIELKEKLTRHVKNVYTVYDDVVRDTRGNEWDIGEFIDEFGEGEYIHADDIDKYIEDNY
jgi:archaellum component FlaC